MRVVVVLIVIIVILIVIVVRIIVFFLSTSSFDGLNSSGTSRSGTLHGSTDAANTATAFSRGRRHVVVVALLLNEFPINLDLIWPYARTQQHWPRVRWSFVETNSVED